MKKYSIILVFFSCFLTLSTNAQDQNLYLPNGTSSIGDASTLNFGFGKSNPSYYVDVLKNTSSWIFHINNTNNSSHLYYGHGSSGNGLLINAGTNQSSSTYAFRLAKPNETNYLFQVQGDGTVGINTASNYSNTKLTINAGWSNWITFKNQDNTGIWAFHNHQGQNSFQLYHTNSNGVTTFDLMHFNDNCQLGIGTSCIPTDGKMAVEGKLYAREVEVNANVWCDYVFDESYELKSFEDLRAYIELNKHLPDVPTTREVLSEGLNLGEMDAILLKKVEELTLYILELEKQISNLQNQVSNQ